MNDQPGLFDLIVPEVPAPARSGRGRARETYARTVVADVTIQNRQALRAAALGVLDGGIVLIGESSDEPDDLLDPRKEIATSDAAAVHWCLEPTTGMELLLESGAVRILSIDMGCDEIERSFSAVWHWTAPPYAPMAGIPGVTWAPISVTTEQILARPR